MKFISLFLVMCFSLNVMASSGAVQELERQIDEYQYVMTVEWDQKDLAFRDEQTKAFIENMSSLRLEKEELLTMAGKKVSNKAAFQALKSKLEALPASASSSEIAQVIKENMKDFYTQGASWNGSVNSTLVIGGIIGLAILFVVFAGGNSGPSTCGGVDQPECPEPYDNYVDPFPFDWGY